MEYQGPTRITRFSDDQYDGLGFIREGAGHGPLRLLASDTALYLLDRLNHRVITLDLTGNVLDTFWTRCCPADISIDSRGQMHMLQNRTLPYFVITYLGGVELMHRNFAMPENRFMSEIAVSPDEEVLLLSGGYTYQIVTDPSDSVGMLYALGERPGRFRTNDSHIGRTEDTWDAVLEVETASGNMQPVTIEHLDGELFQFHTDDRKGRQYVVGTSIKTDEEGEDYVTRRLLITESGKVTGELRDLDANHSSYDFANHDIAVAPNGDIYLWRTWLANGFSEIVRWKLQN